MMERNGSVIRSVAWAEIFPWLNIYKTFRLAIGFRALVMGALAALLTVLGWGMFGARISDDKPGVAWLRPFAERPVQQLTDAVPNRPTLANPLDKPSTPELREPLTGSWAFLSRPLCEGFRLDATFGNTLRLVCCGLWALAIWAFFGAAITRIAVVQLAANERITWGAALRFACSKFIAYFAAPLIPLVGVGLAVLPVLAVAWLLKFSFTAMVLGFFWPVLLIFGLIMTLLLLGVIFGWPLMWPTISTEGSDSFDALSRSYAYVYQRPLHYLFYVCIAAVLGLLGWLLVKNVAASIIWTTYWAASWSAGADCIEQLINWKNPAGESLAGMALAGVWMIHFWAIVVKLLAVGFAFSYFWNANSAIYLLLRRNVDATEMDEVYLDADEGEAKFGLPKIVLDDTGAPEVAEKSATQPAAEVKPQETPPPPVVDEQLQSPSP